MSGSLFAPYTSGMGATGRPFISGFDPRRATGVATAGVNYKQWLNLFDAEDDNGKAKYPADRLRDIAEDPTATPSKRMAAADCLTCHLQSIGRAGRRLGADSTERILDRTDGKPTQRIDVLTQSMAPPAEAWADLLSALADLPDDMRLSLAVSLSAGHVSKTATVDGQTPTLRALSAGDVSTGDPDPDAADGDPASVSGDVSSADPDVDPDADRPV